MFFNFNSHAHVERDRRYFKRQICNFISTHTLTWSVTNNNSGLALLFAFQLTRSRGAWPVLSLSRIIEDKFQLTRSRGAWLFNGKEWNTEKNFNSHAHVERDGKSALSPLNPCDFNSHAHVERDETSSFYDGEDKNFNSHAHVERDAFSFFFVSAPIHFNSHAHVERDVSELRI